MSRGEPFNQRVRNDIMEKITSGYYKKGEFLPSEPNLEKIYRVSRTTIRTAIADLVADGYLTIVRGRGTKVKSSTLQNNEPNLLSFTEIINRKGLKVSIPVIEVTKIKADKKIAELLEINEGEEVYRVFRIRAADDEPIATNSSYIPCKLLEGFDASCIGRVNSLYQNLEEDFHIIVSKTKDNIGAILADAQTAKQLSIKKGDPLLRIERIAYDEMDNVVEYSYVIFRADRYNHAVMTIK